MWHTGEVPYLYCFLLIGAYIALKIPKLNSVFRLVAYYFVHSLILIMQLLSVNLIFQHSDLMLPNDTGQGPFQVRILRCLPQI